MSTTGSTPSDNAPKPTHPRWNKKSQRKALRPWESTVDGEHFTTSPFLASPEGFAGHHDSDKRYHAMVSGIGAGKTTLGLMRVALNVKEWNPGRVGMIIAPTVPALKNVILPEMRKWGFLQNWEYRGKGSQEPGLHAPNGARILLETADNDRKIERLRGPNIAWFWIDEAAQLSPRVWDIAIGRLRAGDYLNAFATTTPKGYNWVYERFYKDSPEDVNLLYGIPSYANPHNPDEFGQITDEYEGQFKKQEVRGLFVPFEGLVYPWFDRSEHVVTDVPENPGKIFYGVDWGHRNPAAILALTETRTGEYVVLEQFYESRCTKQDLAERALDMADRWGPGPIYCDPSEPAAIDTFQRKGLDAMKANNSVTPGIQRVTELQHQLRVHESCQSLINEFGMYRYEDDENSEKPVSVNDHALDALRYALLTFEEQGGESLGVLGF